MKLICMVYVRNPGCSKISFCMKCGYDPFMIRYGSTSILMMEWLDPMVRDASLAKKFNIASELAASTCTLSMSSRYTTLSVCSMMADVIDLRIYSILPADVLICGILVCPFVSDFVAPFFESLFQSGGLSCL